MILSIQLLRFIAAALVVLTHVRIEIAKEIPETLQPFGDFGVDIFFVISGFIMSHISQKNSQYFLTKRLIRIVPLYWAFTLLLAVITFLLPDLLNSASFDITHIIASLLFVPHWSTAAEFKPILLLGWTLNFEMYFYGLFFVSMTVSHRYREFICCALLLGICLSLNFLLVSEPTAAWMFYADPISLEFIFGMLLSVAWRHSLRARGGLPEPLAYALILLSLTCFYLSSFSPVALEAVPRFLIWGVPALLLVVSMMSLEHYFARAGELLQKLILWMGEISYPMYLIHIYFIALLSRIFGLTSIGPTGLFAISIVLTSLASYLTLRLYDIPVRRWLERRVITRQSSLPAASR